MPLLGKEPFVKRTLPDDISPEETVFVCKATNEAFLTYDEFFERQILCSSMVWTCSITNRTGLTYSEALESERNAIQTLNAFPMGLQIPILYLMNRIKDWKLNSIVDTIHSFVANRYFVAEEIQIQVNKRKVNGRVFRVIPPNNCRMNCDNIDPDLYEYEIIDDQSGRHIVAADKISRSKGCLNKDKIKLFLKQHLMPIKRLQPASVKESSKQKFQLNDILWSHIFNGPEPVFKCQIEEPKTTSENKSKKMDKNASASDKKNKTDKSNRKPKSEVDDKERLKEKEKEDKLLQKMKEEQWNSKRDDLACDDLKPLPEPVPLKCKIPVNLFADSLVVMEFFHSFKDLFDIKAIFPSGITLEIMEQILFDKDISGPFVDLIKLLLTSNFSLEEDDGSETPQSDQEDSDDEDRCFREEARDLVIDAKERKSSYYYQWIQNSFGFGLSRVNLDAFNVTEVLRLYLLSSGGGPETKNRRSYNNREDPAIEFVDKNPSLLSKLKDDSIFDLTPEERLKTFHLLILQLLSYSEFKGQIDYSFEEMTKLRKKIRDIQMEFNKWTKDNKPLNKNDAQNESHKSIASNGSTTEERNAYRQEKSHKEEVKFRSCDELRTQIRRLQACYNLRPIGVDRAFRKYWLFESLPGLFVEHTRPDTTYSHSPYGPCLTYPTPNVSLQELCKSDKTDSHRDDSSTTSDKENESTSEPSDRNKTCRLRKISVFDKCTANVITCAVHGVQPIDRSNEWAFYQTTEQLECLVQSLNPRGYRESELKFALNRDKNIIQEYLDRCQAYKLNVDIPLPEGRRSQRLHETHRSNRRKVAVNEDLCQTFVSRLSEDLLYLKDKLLAASLAVMSDSSRNEWRTRLESSSPERPKLIADMSSALLTLMKSIRPMCLSTSFNEDNWSQALTASSSISQLFVYLSVLDDNIKWSKSAREAYCKICRRKCDPQNMLLCDQCNRGHHIYCLQPPLDAIPSDEWFCPECSPKFKPQTPRKAKKRYYESECESSDPEDSDYSESDEEMESSQNTRSTSLKRDMVCAKCRKQCSEELLSCAKCDDIYHLSCTDLKRITRSDWFCHKCLDNNSKPKRKLRTELDFSADLQTSDSNNSEKLSKRSRYSRDSGLRKETKKKVMSTTERRLRSDNRSSQSSLAIDSGLCNDILEKLRNHPNGRILKNPNHRCRYGKAVRQQIDLSELEARLDSHHYNTNVQFFRDVLLMLNNAVFSTQSDSLEYKWSESLAQYFARLVAENQIELY